MKSTKVAKRENEIRYVSQVISWRSDEDIRHWRILWDDNYGTPKAETGKNSTESDTHFAPLRARKEPTANFKRKGLTR